MRRYPSSDAFAGLHAGVLGDAGPRDLRGPQHIFVSGGFVKIDQARIAAGHLRGQADNLAQDLVQREARMRDAAYPVKQRRSYGFPSWHLLPGRDTSSLSRKRSRV